MKKNQRKIIVVVILSFLFVSKACFAEKIPEIATTLDDQIKVAVTIYNENLALVKDTRQLRIPKGLIKLAYREVSAKLRPETALLHAGKSVSVVEQNFDFDLLTPETMIKKFVGGQVEIVKTHPTTGEEKIIPAKILSAQEGVVLQVGNRIETGMPGRLIFPNVPENLRDRPTLIMTLQNQKSASNEIELSYLTGGLNWQADYVAELNEDDSALQMSGWVTLTNTSGTSYHNALLQLVAGDVHQVARPERARYAAVKAMAAPQMESAMREEGLFDYHLYSLQRPTSILENQKKQVALLSAGPVSCTKEYVLKGHEYYYSNRYSELGSKLKVGAYVSFFNKKKSGLGLPLPKGVVRVYKKDSKDMVQFIGEDGIDHTPENESVRLKLGDAFDITAKKKQTDFSKIEGFGAFHYVYESSYEIILNNAKDEEVVVKVVEPMPGDWEILEENISHEKTTSATAVWHVTVPAKDSIKMSYRARVRY